MRGGQPLATLVPQPLSSSVLLVAWFCVCPKDSGVVGGHEVTCTTRGLRADSPKTCLPLRLQPSVSSLLTGLDASGPVGACSLLGPLHVLCALQSWSRPLRLLCCPERTGYFEYI